MIQKDIFGNDLSNHKVADITFHYTKKEMVKDLIQLIPMTYDESILDAGSGKNKIWYNLCPNNIKYECDIDDGIDYLTQWHTKADWVIGNPPFHLGKDFLMKSLDIANKGIAFLVNLQTLNSFILPSRLNEIYDRGFAITRIHIVQDKRWFGRYFFIIFQKNAQSDFITWNERSY